MANEYESMVIYRSFYEAVADCDAETFKKVISAVFEYGMLGIQPKVEGVAKSLFSLMKPQIDANIRRRENGIKGGRPKNRNITEAKPNNNLTKTKVKPNVNVNVNVNDNVNDNDDDDYAERHEGPGEILFNPSVKIGIKKSDDYEMQNGIPKPPLMSNEDYKRMMDRVTAYREKNA